MLGCPVLMVYLEWGCSVAEVRGSFGENDGKWGVSCSSQVEIVFQLEQGRVNGLCFPV